MWYKYDNINNIWYTGDTVSFPDGSKLNTNHQDTKEGFFWSENPPQEYLIWLSEQK